MFYDNIIALFNLCEKILNDIHFETDEVYVNPIRKVPSQQLKRNTKL